MRIFEPSADEAHARSLGGGAEGEDRAPSARRTRGIWAIVLANVLLTGLALLGSWFIAGAERYLINDSAEFGTDLQAAQVGIQILRICCFLLVAGFFLSALGVVSMTPLGWRIQHLWAFFLCLTLLGLPYGVAVLIFIRRPEMRDRFLPPSLSP